MPLPCDAAETEQAVGEKGGKLSEGAKRASFFPPARRLFRFGNPPQAGQERGAFFCLLFFWR